MIKTRNETKHLKTRNNSLIEFSILIFFYTFEKYFPKITEKNKTDSETLKERKKNRISWFIILIDSTVNAIANLTDSTTATVFKASMKLTLSPCFIFISQKKPKK
ncbi:hypothetical protein NH340_JMT00827 [Sarcoptes scabiei]|nr:hypothetical protein NH340_JMT00827 [Sarcoptes scabiei]